MNRKKSVLFVSAILILVLAVTGCAQQAGPGPAAPTKASEAGPAPAKVEAKATTAPAPTVAPQAKVQPTAPPTAVPAKAGDVPTGYYNLADFEAKTGKKFTKYGEAPMLAEKVAKGQLPPVEKRLPDNPLVYRTLDKVGLYGGTLRHDNINVEADWHTRHTNSANLIEMPADAAWDAVSTVYGAPHQPGIYESFKMSSDGLLFSATIRKGLKWSDGTPVTTDDVAFKINDVLLNKKLNPVAAPWLVWGGGKTEFKIIDKQTFEIKFAKPYGSFIEAEITIWPATFQRFILPKHWLSQYHIDYAPNDKLLEIMKAEKYNSLDEWREFFGRKTALFGCDNPRMDNGKPFPTLNPWMVTEDLGNGNFALERNPYFYMVDQEGNQLPYIDRMRRTYMADAKMQDLSIISGKTDYSAMSISIDSYPLYKEHEKDGNYKALLLNAWQDQIYIVGFNFSPGVPPPQLTSVTLAPVKAPAEQSAYDAGLAEIYGDLRFRQALSLALDRKTMNETLFMGLGRPAQVAPRPGTPFYKQGMEEAYAQYDPAKAKALLDEIGLKDVNGDGWRERKDGKPFNVKFDYFVITGASTPGSELVKRYWEAVGIKTNLKLVDPPYWTGSLRDNNINEATTWWLAGSGANLLQNWFLGPSMLNPLWNRYTTYKGQVSDADWQTILKYVPPWQQEMQELKMQLKAEPNEQKRYEIGRRMWELQTEWLPIIGVATDTKTPMIVSADLDNVWMAEEKAYNYITMMEASECWFFKNPERRK